MIILDTSALIDALTGSCRSLPAVQRAANNGERLTITTLVLYEWLRGPRTSAQLEIQDALTPAHAAIEFGPAEAGAAAAIYRQVKNPRQRAVDIGIAACAITRGAILWTLNVRDFRDIPELIVAEPG